MKFEVCIVSDGTVIGNIPIPTRSIFCALFIYGSSAFPPYTDSVQSQFMCVLCCLIQVCILYIEDDKSVINFR